jgi:hypothetical protein
MGCKSVSEKSFLISEKCLPSWYTTILAIRFSAYSVDVERHFEAAIPEFAKNVAIHMADSHLSSQKDPSHQPQDG